MKIIVSANYSLTSEFGDLDNYVVNCTDDDDDSCSCDCDNCGCDSQEGCYGHGYVPDDDCYIGS